MQLLASIARGGYSCILCMWSSKTQRRERPIISSKSLTATATATATANDKTHSLCMYDHALTCFMASCSPTHLPISIEMNLRMPTTEPS